MMCDDRRRFDSASPIRVSDSSRISVVYAGSLGSERWQSIVDLCHAARDPDLVGFNVEVIALASAVPPEAMATLESLSNLRVLAAPSHDDLPRYLKGADVLFLPESFDPLQADTIRLSISSKSHLYMFSRRPILLYGASISGVVQYALREKWAYVVTSRDRRLLQQALRKLLTDPFTSNQLVQTGTEVASRNHEETFVRRKFREAIVSACSTRGESTR